MLDRDLAGLLVDFFLISPQMGADGSWSALGFGCC
jgi:hypothetical protein